MAEITQTLGFDCAQAIDALKTLDRTMAAVQETLQRFAKAGGDFGKVNKAIETNLNRSRQATERLTVSWGYLTSRILYTQFVVSYFGKFRRALEDATKSAVDFEKQVALIRTIDDTGQSFDRVADAARKLSDQFNLPLLDATAGIYNALSNQVGDFGQSLEFTAEAAKFARATGSSLKDATDLLSAALKSYGMNVSDTAKVSGLFFSVIDKGRISASELANTFGRVGPLAGQLGVPLEDLGGALAAISVKGSKTAETLTMYRGILSGLMKPTPELTAQLQKMGFASNEAAIATLHVDGVLKELVKSTGGSSQALAKLFANIRAETGIASLASDFKTLAEDIEAARKAGAKFAEDKWLTATESNADRVTKELNKLRNAMTVDLGQSVLKAGADLSQWVGGADNVVSAAKAAGPALLGLGAGFLILRGKIAASRAELTGLSKGLGLLSFAPMAIGLGASFGQWYGEKMVADAMRGLRELEAANEKALETFKRQQSEKRDAANKADEARVESALKAVRELNKAYLSEVANAKRASESIVANAKAGLQSYLTTRERLVDELAKGAAEANDEIKSSHERIANLIERQGERDFMRSISGMEDPEKAVRTLWRAQELAAKAASALTHAVDKDQIAAALKLFDKAQSTGEDAARIAERVGDRNLEVKAAWALEEITKRQIQAERTLQEIQADRAAKLEAQRAAQQKIVDGIREQIKVVLDNAKLFTKEGQLLPAEDLAKMAAARQEALRKITETALSAEDLDLTKALGLADFVNRFSAELSRDPVKLAFDTEEGLRKAQASIQKAFQDFRVKVAVETGTSLEMIGYALGGRELNTPDAVVRGLVEIKSKAAELRSAYDAAVAGRKAATDTLTATEKAAADSLDRVMQRLSGLRKSAGGMGAFQDAEKALQQFREALADPNLSQERLKALVSAVQPLADRTGLLNWGGVYNAQNVTDFSAALEAMLKRVQALKTLQAPMPDANELNQLESIINRLKAPPELLNLGAAVQGGVLPSATIADNLERAARATVAISANLSTPNVARKAHGGIIKYASSGTLARGTDTIPAMLSPGEFIVNARSARRFLPQLQAINAGAEPVYRETGGNVTNIGDVSISITETNQPKQTAREVMRAIQRETRRGSGRI